ncbi:hypothetical protein Ciccas_014447, partial [Cichlidogyrus casuarinus]
QPKTLPVEVEPNYDKASDRADVIDRFIKGLADPEKRNPKINLRLRFRDKKMLQMLELDDGESLEFDLDIYKAEDQDIPELILNLRTGYQHKLGRVFENPKQPDKKLVSNHLDKLFYSIRLQMLFLVKVLLGMRSREILAQIQEEERAKELEDRDEAAASTESDVEKGQSVMLFVSFAHAEDRDFELIAKFKTKWSKTKKLLDKEICTYRNQHCHNKPESTSTPAVVQTTAAVTREFHILHSFDLLSLI